MKTSLARFAILFGVYASLSAPAHAYLDPATGSIMLQAAIGAVATWIMYSQMFAARAKNWFASLGKGRNTPDSE
jgi:hypothetical protein